MSILLSVKIGMLLFFFTFIVYLLAELSQIELFRWIGAALSVWMILNFFWLCISLLGYFLEDVTDTQNPISIDEASTLAEKVLTDMDEPAIVTVQSQALQQNTLE